MSDRAESTATKAEARALALLRDQADGLRAEIARLRKELTEVQQAAGWACQADLIEANGRLVLSALDAEAAAETASSELGELTRSSQHDALTGTPNRGLMLDRLHGAIALAHRRGTRAAVLFVDLDRFKQINDSLGHAVGDEVLRLVAQRLGSVLRESDTVSRHGGDEFLVLLAELTEAPDAASAAAKMLLAVAEPSRLNEHALQLSCSIGIAVYPEDGQEAATLIARADAAMYRSKQRGRGGFSFHGEDGAAKSAEPDARPPRPGYEPAPAGNEPRFQKLRKAHAQLVIAERHTREQLALAQETNRSLLQLLQGRT